MKVAVKCCVLWLALVTASGVHAGTIDDLKKSCFERASFHEGKHWLEECLEEIITLQPVHPAFRTIAPGTGVGLGIGVDRLWHRGEREFLPSGMMLVSPDGSLLARADFTIALPPISFVQVPVEDKNGPHLHGKRRLALVVDPFDIDAKASISFRSYWMDAKRQDFYGIGPFTTQSGLAFYGLEQGSAGFTVNDPITPWAEAGFSADFFRPRVISVPNASRPSIEQAYNVATAPGLGQHSDYMRYEPYLRFRFKFLGHRTHFTDLKAGYAFYQELGQSTFSFQRLNATSQTEYGIELPSEGTASHRPAWKNFVCPPLRGARHCSMGTLTFVGHVAAAYTGAGSQVPFYFQETLGGADIDGNDTLRGFVDYRFRGPSRMLFQAEYRHGIWGPLGFLSFYDLGRVAQRPSDIAFEHMRHDLGVGITVSATNRVVMRMYVGFGTGEGIRPNYKFGGAL
jgi:hypothetical protein